ncbi:MAG: type II toxin-antitoxin system RelE/ParE family toxin [Bacteroidota bacterium]
MALEIYYTPQSRETLRGIYNFIHNKFGFRSAEKFSIKAEKTILLIAHQPLMFKASNIDEKVRIALISKQTSLFYRITEDSIHLLFFWDNRQEPILPQ